MTKRKPSTALLKNMTEEERLEQAVAIFIDRYKNNIQEKELSKKYGMNDDTVQERIKLAKAFMADDIRRKGEQEVAVILNQYEWLYEEAKREWETTRDVNFHKAMAAILKEKRGLLSLDFAGKLPKSEQGKTMADDRILLIINDAQYADRERKLIADNNIIDTEVRVLKDNE